MISQAGWWTQTPSATSLSAKKMKCSFLYYVQLLMISLGWFIGLEPHSPPLSSKKKWNASFLDYAQLLMWPGWVMDSNPIHHPSPAKKWNAQFWITFNFWWLAGLVNGLKPHPPPVSSQKKWNPHFCITLHYWWSARLVMDSNLICHPLQPIKWNAHFWVMFNFWWLVRLFDELKPHLPPLSSQ